MSMTLERAKDVLRKYSRDCDVEEARRVIAEHEAKQVMVEPVEAVEPMGEIPVDPTLDVPVEPTEPAEIPAEAIVDATGDAAGIGEGGVDGAPNETQQGDNTDVQA